MGIFRTTDPNQFDDVDGIIVNESAPSPSVQGVPANIAILVAQFERGPAGLKDVTSTGELHEIYGKSSFSGNIELRNKRFGRFKVSRVVAADGVIAFLTLQDVGPADSIKFEALDKGLYGNKIQITVEDGTVSGKKYTFKDTSALAVLATEVFDNILVVGKDQTQLNEIFLSKLVRPVSIPASLEPVDIANTPLAAGADGTIIDTDYDAAIEATEVERAGNVLWLDKYNTARRTKLKTHVAAVADRMVIIAGDDGAQDRAGVVTDAGTLRDTAGRIIYAFPYIKTVINAVEVETNPGSWYASIISQTSPHIDPAFAGNAGFLQGMTGLSQTLTRQDYILLKEAGVSAFELDPDIGFKIKSGIVTQISDSSKLTVLRRRMADFLTDSASLFFKNFQNAPNTKVNRETIGGQLLAFIIDLENNNILPSDSEVKSGLAKIVDTESLNTDASIAAGFNKILWKQRIFSSMRFIVLQAEIGESVVVTEG